MHCDMNYYIYGVDRWFIDNLLQFNDYPVYGFVSYTIVDVKGFSFVSKKNSLR